MDVPPRTSAEEHRNYFPGKMIHLGEGPAWQNILVEIHHRNPVEQTLLIPAVAEPQLIWQISGHLLCSDRDLGGEWNTHEVEPGDFPSFQGEHRLRAFQVFHPLADHEGPGASA